MLVPLSLHRHQRHHNYHDDYNIHSNDIYNSNERMNVSEKEEFKKQRTISIIKMITKRSDDLSRICTLQNRDEWSFGETNSLYMYRTSGMTALNPLSCFASTYTQKCDNHKLYSCNSSNDFIKLQSMYKRKAD